MSWLMKAAGAVKSVATTTGNVVGAAVNAATEVVAGAIESGAKAAEDGYRAAAEVFSAAAELAAEFSEGLPLLGPTLSGIIKAGGAVVAAVTEWVGSALSAGLTFVATVIKGVGAIVSGIVVGLITMAGGILALDGDLVIGGALGMIFGVAGAVMTVGGKGIEIAQQLAGLQDEPRRLDDAEIALLTRVFRGSLTLEHIRVVVDNAGPVFGLNERAFVLGNTIFLKGSTSWALFVHEAIHVWQYQKLGANYSAEAVYAQNFVDDAYSWSKEIHERGKSDWSQFNLEAQGRFFEDVYRLGELFSHGVWTSGDGAFFDADPANRVIGRLPGFDPDGNDDSLMLTALANQALLRVRSRTFLLPAPVPNSPSLLLGPPPTPSLA